MVGPISVLNSRELLATVYAIKAAPDEVRKNIRRFTKQAIEPQWTNEIRKRASSAPRPAQAHRVIAASSKVRVSDRGVVVTGGSSRRKALSGGLVPFEHAKAIEFGSNKYKQLRPRRERGTTFYPAATEMQPRVLALWVQTTVKTIMDALEGRT